MSCQQSSILRTTNYLLHALCGVAVLGLLSLVCVSLSAQEGVANVESAGAQANETTGSAPVSRPVESGDVPTLPSGKPMQAYGAKKSNSWLKKPNSNRVQTHRSTMDDEVSSGAETAVLPPIPAALQPAEEKSGWFTKRKEAQQTRQIPEPEIEHVMEGQTSVAPAPPQMATTPPPPPTYYQYDGPPLDPTTPTGKPLRAFNRESRHIKDQQVVAQGTVPESGGALWVKRATDIQGEEPSGSKWSWENPFDNPRTRKPATQVVPVAGAQAGGEITGPGGSGRAASGVADDTQLLASLQGVVVVPRTLDVKKKGRSGVSGILTEGVVLPEKVQRNFDEYLGKPLSLSVLDKMVRGAVVAFRSSDMPVVDVLVPEQEINGGVLQLVVIEGRVGKVVVEGAEYTDPEYLKKQVSLKTGQVLRESTLMADLQWMNKNPFRQVDMIYSPGYDYGSTDLILRTHDVRPLSFYVGIENSGNELLGENRLLAGFNWGGPLFFGLENTLSYQYVSDLEFDKIQGHSAVWMSNLPWRHQLTLLGAYVDQGVDTMAAGEIVDIGGRDYQGSMRYTMPLKGTGRWIHETELGFDFKSSNSNLGFGGFEVYDTTTQVLQASLGYNIIESDRWGTTKMDNELLWSPGGLTGENSTEAFRSQRGGAKADYVYGRSAIERNTYLPKNWGLITRAEGQLSSANLLASEALGAGGYDTVRGFEERIVLGDQGVVATVELRTPSLTLANLLGYHNARDGMQLLTFFDYGFLSKVDSAEGAPSSFSLGSAGVGLRYQLDDNFSLRLDYGYQLIESGFDDGENARFHFGARANF